jgi:hypothetical protein
MEWEGKEGVVVLGTGSFSVCSLEPLPSSLTATSSAFSPVPSLVLHDAGLMTQSHAANPRTHSCMVAETRNAQGAEKKKRTTSEITVEWMETKKVD